MRIKQDLPTYNAPIYLRTECSERKKTRDAAEQEKNPQIQICYIICAANSQIRSASPIADRTREKLEN
jgi:hypothetical protein